MILKDLHDPGRKTLQEITLFPDMTRSRNSRGSPRVGAFISHSDKTFEGNLERALRQFRCSCKLLPPIFNSETLQVWILATRSFER